MGKLEGYYKERRPRLSPIPNHCPTHPGVELEENEFYSLYYDHAKRRMRGYCYVCDRER